MSFNQIAVTVLSVIWLLGLGALCVLNGWTPEGLRKRRARAARRKNTRVQARIRELERWNARQDVLDREAAALERWEKWSGKRYEDLDAGAQKRLDAILEREMQRSPDPTDW